MPTVLVIVLAFAPWTAVALLAAGLCVMASQGDAAEQEVREDVRAAGDRRPERLAA